MNTLAPMVTFIVITIVCLYPNSISTGVGVVNQTLKHFGSPAISLCLWASDRWWQSLTP